jgi:hypothetical protein
MWSRNVILTGTVVVEQTAFRWAVTDGFAQQLMVCHPTLGAQIEPLNASPDSQARLTGRAMLKDAAKSAAIGFIDKFDDAPMPSCDPEPTIY